MNIDVSSEGGPTSLQMTSVGKRKATSVDSQNTPPLPTVNNGMIYLLPGQTDDDLN